MEPKFLSDNYWNNRYLSHETGWDLKVVSPPLKLYFDTLVDKKIKILIPGAGYGYEAEYLINQGFTNVHIVEFAPEALNRFQSRVPNFPFDQLHCEDFFRHVGNYDLIIEQTFFCALEPELRPNYVNKMHSLLKPKGLLVGLLFNIPLNTDKPPYGGHMTHYKNLFSVKMALLEMDITPLSIKPRAGNELFFRVQKQ